MTTELDPIRWTESSEDAPELLRAPFAAATREGPSAAQMRMLALKLSAVAAGTAVAATASTAQASATAGSTLAGGAAASSALPLAKIVAAAVVVGATALGGVAFFSKPAEPHGKVPTVQSNATSMPENTQANEQTANGTTNVAPVTREQAEAEPAIEAQGAPVVEREAQGNERLLTPKAVVRASQDGAAKERAPQIRSTKVSPTPKEAATSVAAEREAHERQAAVPSEVELLRRARSALASRPRDAFALTEQHREHYARGVFAQERDALAIEALLRAGDTEAARDLAKRFISAHPSSPHAHRFRETLGL